MPEPPDFNKIADDLMGLTVEDEPSASAIAEQLRLVWNARGAADREVEIADPDGAFQTLVTLQRDLLQLFDLDPTDQPASLIDRIRHEVTVLRGLSKTHTLSGDPAITAALQQAWDLGVAMHMSRVPLTEREVRLDQALTILHDAVVNARHKERAAAQAPTDFPDA